MTQLSYKYKVRQYTKKNLMLTALIKGSLTQQYVMHSLQV